MTFHQPRRGGSFIEGVLHLEGQELVQDQRTGRKVASDGATQWPLLWKLDCFCYDFETKGNKSPKYSKILCPSSERDKVCDLVRFLE